MSRPQPTSETLGRPSGKWNASRAIEIEPRYCALAEQWLERELKTLFGGTECGLVSRGRFTETQVVSAK
jgi:hypothetical protein